MRVWDVQPFCPTDRMLKVFVGAQHNFEKNLIKVREKDLFVLHFVFRLHWHETLLPLFNPGD